MPWRHSKTYMEDLLSSRPTNDPEIQKWTKYKNSKAQMMHKLLSKDWFTRVWTLQEVALATKAYLQCGSEVIEWETLAQFNERCQSDDTGCWGQRAEHHCNSFLLFPSILLPENLKSQIRRLHQNRIEVAQ